MKSNLNDSGPGFFFVFGNYTLKEYSIISANFIIFNLAHGLVINLHNSPKLNEIG